MKFRELKEEAFNRLHALQLKKNHPVEGGDPTDKEIDKEINEIFKILRTFWEMIKSIILMTGLIIFIIGWCIVIFFLWIYDAIFGGWK